MTRTAAVIVAIVLSALFALAAPRAFAADLNFAGSAQLDEFFVPTQSGNANQGTGEYAFDGFTLEATEKVAADVSNRVSANLKVCFGCHGFELDMGYVDFRVADELNIRAGRFSPSFGAFNLRHDVGNHKLSDKPLPYDMGRMLRMRAWNLGVLPSPFPDTGLEVNGTHWAGNQVQIDYAIYVVQGFRSTGDHPTDIDFRLSHAFPLTYFVDNNGFPTVGARTALTLKLGDRSDMTVGVSGMFGTYDNKNNLTYAIWGADFALRISRTFLRMEYLARRTQVDTSDPNQFALQLAQSDDFTIKHGAYVELEQPLLRDLDLIARVDGMYRVGNFPVIPIGQTPPTDGSTPETPLKRHSWMGRFTLGTSWAVERALRLKLSGELWEFSDADDDTHTQEIGIHAAVVGTF